MQLVHIVRCIIILLVVCTSLAQTTTTQSQNSVEHQTTTVVDSNQTAIGFKYTTWIAFADRFIPWALWADRYVTLIYYILGFPGNLISLIVWTSRRMYKGNSAAIYLAALSLNDIIILIFALHRDLGRNWGVFSLMTPGTCEVLNTVFSAVQYASPLYVLGFTIERWLAVCRPFLIDRICNAKRAIYICLVICAGTILICLGNAVRSGTQPTHCYKRFDGFAINFYLTLLEAIFSGIVPLMVLIFNCLVIRELARVHRTNRDMATVSSRLSGMTGAPMEPIKPKRPRIPELLSCSRCQSWKNHRTIRDSGASRAPLMTTVNDKNGCTNQQDYIKTVSPRSSRSSARLENSRSNGVRHTSTATHSPGEEKHNHSFRSTTFMLLCVSFYMIIATLLAGSMYLLNHIFDEPDLTLTEEEALQDPLWQLTLRILTIKTFGDEIAMSYYAFGFIIYYATGHSFRERVHQILRTLLIRCGCCRETLSKYRASDDFEFTSASRRTQRRITTQRQYSVPVPYTNDTDTHVNRDHLCVGQYPPANGCSNQVQLIPELGETTIRNMHTSPGHRVSTATNGVGATRLDMHIPEVTVTGPIDANTVPDNINNNGNEATNGVAVHSHQTNGTNDSVF